ncbi:MAG: polysaccharide biosynthesis/export family protein [Bacteroidia bacterium]|nr:polysaccharide biosynthesis/export family protein [Bacteroidia bacterium]
MKCCKLIITIIALSVLSSCASRKDYIYFQDEMYSDNVEMSKYQQLTYKTDDLLIITISGLDPEAARPFNLPAASTNNNDVTSAQGQLRLQTYLVDYDGFIDFPVLGKLKIAGLTRTQVTDMLTNQLRDYLKDPIVNVRLANFNVTIIGEVNNPGTFNIQDERITLLEALGLAGDLSIYGKRSNVLLIRENEGKKKFAKIDLTSINTINSPLFYLQQNDVIYVEPNNAKIRQASYSQNNSVVISAIGTLTTIIAVFLVNRN